jgi:drug/metabolite transporter (DMT)-like permease
VYTTAGKAGFITGLYLIIVPVMGIFWKQQPGWKTSTGAIIALAGLYLLCMKGKFTMVYGDILVFFSSIFWALHVLWIGHFSSKIYPLTLACLQFAVCSLLAFITAFAIETMSAHAIMQASIPILYAGLCSTGIAFTLQVVAQQFVPSSNAAIIMSLEAVFAAVGGWIILDESLTVRGLAGCACMLAGMVLSQLDPKATRSLPEL